MLICSIGAVNATDLDDNSAVEVSSDVDDSISVDEVPITDDVEQSQDVASTNAATWDELKTACQSSGDKVITLTGQSYNANSQIVFGNSATIVGSSDSYITEGNYTFRNNTFTNSPQTIGTDNNIIESNNVNLLKSLKFRSIVFNQPISDFNTVAQNQWAMSGYDNHNSANVPYIGVTTNPNIWKNDVGGVVSGLVIDEEGTFYLTAGSNVTAFDSTGFLKWSKNLGQVTMPGLALDNRGNIIIPVKDNRLVILNKTTGADLGGNIFQASSAYAPMLDDDGNIYVVGQYEYDNCYVPIVKYYNSTHYNPNGGYDYAYKSLFNTAVSTIPVLDNNGVLWAVSGTNLVAVDIKTGNQVASYTDCYSGIRPIVGENGIVYFVKSDRKVVYAVSVSGYLWNTSLPTYQLFGTKYEQATALGIDNEKNTLYVGTSRAINKIDMTTGNLTVFRSGFDMVNSIIIDGNGTLYTTKTSQGSLWAFYSNGTQAWSKKMGGSLKLLAMDKNGNIYTSYNNYLCVLYAQGVDPNMTIDAKNILANENTDIVVKLLDSVYGNVVFTIGNDTYTVAIENGSAKLNIGNLSVGSYNVTASFAGNIKYAASENNASFIVSKIPTNMIIAVDDIKVGEDAVINITLPNEISNELVSVTIDGKSYTVLINNGKGSLILSNLVDNSYPITAKYDGNYKYTEGENTTALTVAKMSSAVNVTANNIKFGEEAVINIAVPNVSLGVATVVVNGKSYNVAIVDEKGVLNIYNLAAGDYNVDVTYLGDNKYLSSTNAANFTVSKVSDYNMTVDIADIVKGENATITVTIPEDGTGSVIVTINGTNYKGTVIKGIAKVIIPDLDEGTYKVVTFYTGDNKYDSMIVNGTITVNKNTITTLTMNNLVKYFGSSQRLVAKLADALGNPIANATVYFTINGKVHARITDENGTASIAIRLLPGEYKASALFNGTKDHDKATANATVTVKSTIFGNDTTLYFRNGTQYMAKFLDSDGKALANTDVKFNINGVFYTRVTDENGIARLNIRLDPASYIITAYNPVTGEQKANNITVLPRIIAKDLSMKYLDGSTFNAALVDGQGKAISGVNITFNINGVFYHRTTDVNGVASLNIRLISGVYIITSMYDECWASNKITISA
nr:Ig-like domain-containing protein [Methanobrevibacter smithii]